MRKSRRLGLAIATAAALSVTVPSVRASVVVYDNVTNAENNPANFGGADDGNEFTFLGTEFNPNTGKASSSYGDNAGGGFFALAAGTTDITGFDLFPIIGVTNNTGGVLTGSSHNYSGLKITVDVWAGINLGVVNASNPAFSNLLGTYTFTDYEGTGAFQNGYIYNYESGSDPGVIPGITLPTPIAIPSTVGFDSADEPVIGISYLVQATNGSNGATATYSAVNGVSPTYTYGSPATVGDSGNVFNSEFLFNYANDQTGNFAGTATISDGPYHFTGLNDTALALRAYGDVVPVPEPTSAALLGLSALALLGRRKRAVSFG